MIEKDQDKFNEYLQTINRQIKDIEKLVNEFSNFARMPSPIFKKIKIMDIINRAVDLLKPSIKSEIKVLNLKSEYYINGDEEQLNRVFLNIIKNADESISEIINKKADYKGKIDIEIVINNDYIITLISDNGKGVKDTKNNDAIFHH